MSRKYWEEQIIATKTLKHKIPLKKEQTSLTIEDSEKEYRKIGH
jgi:hypothetical protein